MTSLLLLSLFACTGKGDDALLNESPAPDTGCDEALSQADFADQYAKLFCESVGRCINPDYDVEECVTGLTDTLTGDTTTYRACLAVECVTGFSPPETPCEDLEIPNACDDAVVVED
ncbi:hypothetical protein L6R46_00075 [Myxococcota bacterium]|nr:hypothetical protein [Myxococcota bacterium]